MPQASTSLDTRIARGDPAILQQLLALLAEAITVRDLQGTLVFANETALTRLGLLARSELRGHSGTSLMADYAVTDEQGRAVSEDDLPAVRLLRGDSPAPLLIRAVHRRTGKLIWSLLKSSALLDEQERLIGAVTVIEDLTAVKRAETRTKVLAASGQILASSLEFEQTLNNVAEIAVPSVVDYCAVDIVDAAGRLVRAATMLDDPQGQVLADELRDLRPLVPDPDHPRTPVLTGGESLHLPQVTDADLDALAWDSDHAKLLRQLEIRSYMTVPLRVPNRTIGLLTLATTSRSGRTLDDEDLALAEQLGRRAAVAVENSRLYGQLTTVAQTLQRSLSPNPLPDIPEVDVAALYRPARAELRLDLGGDFYEFFEHHGVWYVILGDVAGKGIRAASVTSLMRHGARVACRSEPEPGKILARLNEALLQVPDNELATAVCACIHPDHIVISSAGHPPAMLVASDGTIREVSSPGPLLGAFDDGHWPEQEFSLGPLELMVMYTDGVIEAPGYSNRYGLRRLRRLLGDNAALHPRTVIERLQADLGEFSAEPANDDVAVLAMRTKIADAAD